MPGLGEKNLGTGKSQRLIGSQASTKIKDNSKESNSIN
jgi:hypothetical protein